MIVVLERPNSAEMRALRYGLRMGLEGEPRGERRRWRDPSNFVGEKT